MKKSQNSRKLSGKILLFVLIAINLLNLATPFVAKYVGEGAKDQLKIIYSFFAPLDHQYIYRSFCLFDGKVRECIPHNYKGEVLVYSKYTTINAYSGEFYYSKEDVGKKRSDLVLIGGELGYKFPVCARDTGFYLGILLGFLVQPLVLKNEKFGLGFLIVAMAPIGIDGTLQLISPYESTVTFRFLTGVISGVLTGFIIGTKFN